MNCRVLLIEIHRRNLKGEFEREFFPVPRQFPWAPAEFGERDITLYDEWPLDFGELLLGRGFDLLFFEPEVNGQRVKQGGALRSGVYANQAVKYILRVYADHFRSPPFSVDVDWDGTWCEDSSIRDHLKIHVRDWPYQTDFGAD
jgi:hypothetical protein